MSDNKEKPPLSLGSNFEVIEDQPATPASETPAAAPAAAPVASGAGNSPAVMAAPSGSDPYAPPHGPIRSANAWASMGLVIAIAGLLGPWADYGGNLAHGLLLAVSAWFLVRGGFLAVQRTGATIPAALPAMLLAYGGLRLAMSDGLPALGWDPTAGVLDSSGALLTIVGGLLALVMPRTIARKKDAKLPPAGAPLQLDRQFSRSLLAYLMIFFGMQMQWTDQAAGVDSLLGELTLLLAMLMVWASWVAMWQLWQKPLVLGKLGMLLFIAPMEAFFMGGGGIIRLTAANEETFGFLLTAYPSDAEELNFFAFAGGPLLVTGASLYALYLVFSGAKEAQVLIKQRREDEVAARKATRASKKGSKVGAKKS